MMESNYTSSLTHGSLFSGIGGFDYTADLSGWKNLFNCEIDPFCKTILNHHFPNAKQYTDIKTTDFSVWRGKIDVLSGGFPCQPFSQAGKRRGTDDNRYLWPEMLRAIREIEPRWIVGENVLGIVNWNGGMVFEQVCADLEAEGYEVQPYVLPACGVDAPHRRYRTFFVAHCSDAGTQNVQRGGGNGVSEFKSPSYTYGTGFQTPWPEQRTASVTGIGMEWHTTHTRGNEGVFDAERKSTTADSDCGLRKRTQRGGVAEQNGIPPVYWTTDSTAGQPCGANRSDDEGGITYKYVANSEGHRQSWRCENDDRANDNQAERTDFFGGAKGYGGEWTFADTAGECGEERINGQSNEHCELFQFDRFPTQPPVCGRNDGFSDLLDADAIYQGRAKVNRANPFARWRTESIKGYGNAIVPPLVYRIFRAINDYEAGLWES